MTTAVGQHGPHGAIDVAHGQGALRRVEQGLAVRGVSSLPLGHAQAGQHVDHRGLVEGLHSIEQLAGPLEPDQGVGRGVQPQRPLARSQRVPKRLRPGVRCRGQRPVVRELGDPVVASRISGHQLHGCGNVTMEPRPAGDAEPLVQGVLDECVGKGEPPRLDLDHQGGASRGLEQVEDIILGLVDDHSQHGELEVATDHRGCGQTMLGFGSETGDAASDDLPDVRRQPAALQQRGGGPSTVGLLDDGPGLGQVPQELADEERVAVRLGEQGVTEGEPVLAEPVARRGFHQAGQGRVVEPAQRHSLDAGLAMRCGEELSQWELAVTSPSRNVARTANEPASRSTIGLEQLHARIVGPVEVVEHQDDGRTGGQQLAHRGEQQVLVTIAGFGVSLAQAGKRARESSRVRTGAQAQIKQPATSPPKASLHG